MKNNIILNTDSYKASHYKQYPAGTKFVSSYVESRGGRWDKTVFFGLQALIKEYLTTPITQEMIDEAEEIFLGHGEPFNREGWEYILNAHNGYMPVEIKALKEGTVLSTRNALIQIVNTDEKCPWVTSYLETLILRSGWYATTVATLSYHIKQDIIKGLNTSADDPAAVINFMLNDFGSRGVSSYESSALGGLAHLVNFMGSDNIPAVVAARRLYDCKMAGFSIPAAEHSTITSWGRENEVAAYRNMIQQFAPNKILAVVSDSYDIYNACEHLWGGSLKDEVINSGARVVVRPDSGDATTVPVKCVEILMEKFGYTVNSKGFKVLPTYIRVIQGDGINQDSIKEIIKNMLSAGYSLENVCFGMGGGLLQQLDRDTLKFAMKCSAIMIGDTWQDVYKDPIDDKGKASKKGVLAVVKYDVTGEYITIREKELSGRKNYLEPVYRNGVVLRTQTLDEIRALAAAV